MQANKIVSREEWVDARKAYLTKEKNLRLYNPDNWDIYFIRPRLLLHLKRSPSKTGC